MEPTAEPSQVSATVPVEPSDFGCSWQQSALQFATIAVAVLVADFSFLILDSQPPILNDDWALYADLVWDEARAPLTKIREILVMSWEGRPLRAIEYGLQWAAYQLLGIRGGFVLQALILCLLGWQFTRIVRPRLGSVLGLGAGLLLVLHPADSTHIWLATMMAKLSLLYTLIAVRAFAQGRERWAVFFLVLGFASYELSPFAFALAAWARAGRVQDHLKRSSAVFLIALSFYALWRYLVFATVAPDLRILAGEATDLGSALQALAEGFGSVLPIMLIQSFCRSTLALMVSGGVLVVALFVGGLVGDRLSRVLPPGPKPSALRRAVAMGILATLLGASLAFVAAPTLAAGIASRHTIAALPGAALALTASCGLLAQLWSAQPRLRAFTLAVPLAVLVLAASNRWLIQQDYRAASRHQRQALKRMVIDLGPLPAHSLVVITNPQVIWPESERRADGERAVEALETGFAHEIEAILGLVYDRSIVGVALADDRDLSRVKIATASQILAEKPAEFFHNIVSYDMATHESVWHRRRDPSETRLVAASGPAWAYLGM